MPQHERLPGSITQPQPQRLWCGALWCGEDAMPVVAQLRQSLYLRGLGHFYIDGRRSKRCFRTYHLQTRLGPSLPLPGSDDLHQWPGTPDCCDTEKYHPWRLVPAEPERRAKEPGVLAQGRRVLSTLDFKERDPTSVSSNLDVCGGICRAVMASVRKAAVMVCRNVSTVCTESSTAWRCGRRCAADRATLCGCRRASSWSISSCTRAC